MTFPPDHHDPKHPGEPNDLPASLLCDLRQTYHADEVQPPSRVGDAVLAAASKHFAAQQPVVEPKTGVLGWIGQRPLRSAGLGGALLAASVLIVVLIFSPNQPTPGDRSVAMDAFMEPDAEETRGIASEERLGSPAAAPPASGRSAGDLAARDMALESEMAESLMDLAPRRREAYISSPPFLQGDVNGDGAVTIADALLLARMVDEAGGTLDEPRFDLLGNGTVSRADADAIARLVVRLAPAPENTNTEGAS